MDFILSFTYTFKNNDWMPTTYIPPCSVWEIQRREGQSPPSKPRYLWRCIAHDPRLCWVLSGIRGGVEGRSLHLYFSFVLKQWRVPGPKIWPALLAKMEEYLRCLKFLVLLCQRWKTICQKKQYPGNLWGIPGAEDKLISFQVFVCPVLLWPDHGTLINFSLQAMYLGDVLFFSSINLEDRIIKLQ